MTERQRKIWPCGLHAAYDHVPVPKVCPICAEALRVLDETPAIKGYEKERHSAREQRKQQLRVNVTWTALNRPRQKNKKGSTDR